jgi:dienelactone hydrolase
MIKTETIRYAAGETSLEGYVAWDDDVRGARPAVLVVHEWWGVGDYVQRRARMLAELGYVGVAVDLFGEGWQTEDPSEASAKMNESLSDLATMRARFEAGMKAAAARPEVDASKISAIGYCFGGAVVLYMARLGLDLASVAAFHPGSLDLGAPTPQGGVKAKVLACVGGDDPMVPVDRHEAFRADMRGAGAEAELIVFPGVTHSFTNPAATERGERLGLPLKYDEKADTEGWERMRALLASVS